MEEERSPTDTKKNSDVAHVDCYRRRGRLKFCSLVVVKEGFMLKIATDVDDTSALRELANV